MSLRQVGSVLVLTLDAYRFSTRARKAAESYSRVAPVTFVGLSGAGRTGRWDQPCDVVRESGLRVRQIYVRRPWVQPNRRSQLRNTLLCYLPAFLRMAWAVMRSPADVIHVTGTPLTALGLIHRLRFKSRMVLDIQERPGAVASSGSLTSYFSKFESLLLRLAARRAELATVVTQGDVATITGMGFRAVQLVRNAPLNAWRAPYTRPSENNSFPLRLIAVGTIFEGRGYEALLRAAARAAKVRQIQLTICGPGRAQYLDSLKQLTEALGISALVNWMDAVESSKVSELYLDAHVGLVLYEPLDPGNDGLSNKILECVSSGRPVIAGDLPENRRFVQENRVGWLTEVTESGIADVLVNLDTGVNIVAICDRCRGYGDTWLNWESEFDKIVRHVLPDCIQSPSAL